jgi:hypothetical protein
MASDCDIYSVVRFEAVKLFTHMGCTEWCTQSYEERKDMRTQTGLLHMCSVRLIFQAGKPNSENKVLSRPSSGVDSDWKL